MGNFKQEFPGGFDSLNTLRLKISAWKIDKQNLEPKDQNHIRKTEILSTWDMIAPTDIQENLSHSWEEYHSFQGKAAQLFSDKAAAVARVAQGAAGLGRKQGDTNPGRAKVDSPIVYAGSERLEYSFTFLLMQYKNIKEDVINPIHDFRRLSCAVTAGQALDTIQFPCIFSVESSPAPFINLPDAALTNVQVLYNAPYKGGLPSRAEMTLTFRDIRPLYRGSFGDVGGVITTGFRG
jgi:hypothetical protein